MPLNKQSGNMYNFVTHTWNPIRGECEHDCIYCYMKSRGKLPPLRLVEKEFKTNLGKGKFIFVGSSTDMFADHVPNNWILKTLSKCLDHPENMYLFQTKNSDYYYYYKFKSKDVLCITLETNRSVFDYSKAIDPVNRALSFAAYNHQKKMVTIEPIIDFDMDEFIELIKYIKPFQVNIGADSKGHNLPEPSKEKVIEYCFSYVIFIFEDKFFKIK